jgi:hypothetical protein
MCERLLAAQGRPRLCCADSRSRAGNGGATVSIACGVSSTHIKQIRTSADRRTRPCAYRHTDRPVRHDTGWLPWRPIRLPTIGRISRAISRVGRYRSRREPGQPRVVWIRHGEQLGASPVRWTELASSTPIPKQIHWIVTKPGRQPIPVSSASAYRIVAAGPVTDVRHVR